MRSDALPPLVYACVRRMLVMCVIDLLVQDLLSQVYCAWSQETNSPVSTSPFCIPPYLAWQAASVHFVCTLHFEFFHLSSNSCFGYKGSGSDEGDSVFVVVLDMSLADRLCENTSSDNDCFWVHCIRLAEQIAENQSSGDDCYKNRLLPI